MSSFMRLVDTPEQELEQLLMKHLDSCEYKRFPSQKQQFDILRAMLLDPKNASGQYTWKGAERRTELQRHLWNGKG